VLGIPLRKEILVINDGKKLIFYFVGGIIGLSDMI